MKSHELQPSLARTGLSAAYLLVGEEDFLRDRALAVIQEASVGTEACGDFNCDMFYADECAASDIVSCAKDLPVFAQRRLVIVRGAEKLPAREAEQLIPYLKAPNETTTLVFLASKLDGRLKFSQVLKERAQVVDCGPLPSGQAPAWVRAQASRLGLALSEEAVVVVADLVGRSLSLVMRELEKLALLVPQGTTAGPADVEAIRGAEPGASVFDLSGAICAGDYPRALRILARNLEAGEAPLRILGSLAWQYRRIWKASALLAMGATDGEVGKALGVPPFRLREFLGQARVFGEAQLRAAFERFVETDTNLKGGSATTPDLVIEALVLRLCADMKAAGASGTRQATPPTRPPQPPGPRKTRPINTVRTIRSGLK